MKLKYFGVILFIFLLSGCENYNDCFREIIGKDVESSEKRRLHELCVYEHEKTLSLSQKDNLKGTASINKLYGSSGELLFLEVSLKNQYSNVMITEVEFSVSVKDGEIWKDAIFKSRRMIEPGTKGEYKFDDSEEIIRLKNASDSPDWNWSIKSAKGVSLN